MKKSLLLSLIATIGFCATSCYDDSALNTRIDGLEDRVEALEQMNTDIEAMRALVEGLQSAKYIKTITPTSEGYDITLSSGEKVSIKNGEKGNTGAQGKEGATGPQGKPGEKGDAPVIGVKLDGGSYYWTVNGDFVTDDKGGKMPVSGITPKLKYENSSWFVSYDGGTTWEKLAEAVSAAEGFFTDVEVKASSVVFSLLNGESFEIPLGNGFVLSVAKDVACLPGTTTGVPYVITGASNPLVYCVADGAYSSYIKKDSETTGSVMITAKENNAEGQVLVFASNEIRTLVKAISLCKGQLIVKDAYTVDAEGGNLKIAVETNLNYVAKSTVSWITIAETKAEIRKDTVVANIAANPGGNPERTGEIQICGLDGSPIQNIQIIQNGDGSIVIKGYLYPTYDAQTIDPSTKFEGYPGTGASTSAEWITVEPDGKLTLTENNGIIRSAYVQYGSKSICVIQNPGNAFLDFYFEDADGDMSSMGKNSYLKNAGTANKLSTGPTDWIGAYKCSDQGYSKPVTIQNDETLGHKVANFHNTQAPSSYGSCLWRNANGNTVKDMWDGFTVELYLYYNVALWQQGGGKKDSEGNAFCFKSTTSNAGSKALSVGVIGNASGMPVFTCILSGKRFSSSYELDDKEYYHFVVTYDSKAQQTAIFVNGEQVASNSETRDMSTILELGSATPWWNALQTNINSTWVLGAYLNGEWQTSNSCWNGCIANCRVYGETLSASDIAKSYKIISTPIANLK